MGPTPDGTCPLDTEGPLDDPNVAEPPTLGEPSTARRKKVPPNNCAVASRLPAKRYASVWRPAFVSALARLTPFDNHEPSQQRKRVCLETKRWSSAKWREASTPPSPSGRTGTHMRSTQSHRGQQQRRTSGDHLGKGTARSKQLKGKSLHVWV